MTGPCEELSEDIIRTLNHRTTADGAAIREAENAYCLHVLAIGLRHALRQGMTPEDQADCAMELVVRMLEAVRERGSCPMLDTAHHAWLLA